jgi:hypothetical protein
MAPETQTGFQHGFAAKRTIKKTSIDDARKAGLSYKSFATDSFDQQM